MKNCLILFGACLNPATVGKWLIYSFFMKGDPLLTFTNLRWFSSAWAKKTQDLVPYTVANGPYCFTLEGQLINFMHSARWIPQGCAPVQIGIWSRVDDAASDSPAPPPPKKKKMSCIRESPILFQGFMVNGLQCYNLPRSAINYQQISESCLKVKIRCRVVMRIPG